MIQPHSLKATPHEIDSLINYQDGAVVSREIVKTDKTTVTLFAFDKKQGLSEHMTPFTGLVQVIDGEALITVGGKAHTVKSGQILLMPANVPHALLAEKPFKMILVMAR